MLDILRHFAVEKLVGLQEVAYSVRYKHAHYYAAFLQTKTAVLKGGNQKQAYNEIQIEIENIHTAWEWSIQNQQWQLIEISLESLFHFYDTHSWFQKGKNQFEQALSNLPPAVEQKETLIRAKLSARLGWFTFHLGHIDQATQLLTDSLTQLKTLQAETALVFPLNYLGAIKRHQGEQQQNPTLYQEARHYLNQGLQLAQNIGDNFGASVALNILGQIASLEGNFAQARQLCTQGMNLKRQIGDRWGMTFSLLYLGRVSQAMGQYQEAQASLQESLQISREFNDRRGVANALYNLAEVARTLEREPEAQQHYQESLQIFQEIGNQRRIQQVYAKLSL